MVLVKDATERELGSTVAGYRCQKEGPEEMFYLTKHFLFIIYIASNI